MLRRRLESLVQDRLRQFPAVALLGPRQVGKTTLAQRLAAEQRCGSALDYLDLENPADLQKLEDAAGYLAARTDRLVIIDEVQRAPGLFQILRGVIDRRILDGQPAGHFLLLGSASLDLLHQSSETLAGRIAYLELDPFDVLEVDADREDELWSRGGFPRSFLAQNDQDSATWRDNFITTYLERDIPTLGPRIPAATLRRFWTMLSHSQGGLLNAAALARSLAVDGKTITKYLDLLEDLLLVRRLPPQRANIGKRLVKSPKIYVRDSGLVHTLLRLDTLDQLLGHPVAGTSWEGHVIETLLRAAPTRTQPSFYRSAAGAEIDLLLALPGDRLWAVEIKRSTAPKVERGFRIALEDLRPDKAFIVYSGRERYPRGEGLETISARELATELADLT
ncbi:MAG: ATP-binding protein [Pseudomonadota bacterium]